MSKFPKLFHGALVVGAILVGAIGTGAYSQSVVSDSAAFVAENNAAMEKMMAAMHVDPTGDVDADFVAMMIPHHQGAIDMAMAQLRYGKNEQLRRIAQEIIVEQQQEIMAMRVSLGQSVPPSAPVQTQASPQPPAEHPSPVRAKPKPPTSMSARNSMPMSHDHVSQR